MQNPIDNASRSRSEYARRMNRVLDHIDAHLAEPLELVALAEVAHFSPYHFHRLFDAWMGETLGAYLRRRRLEAGAGMLQAQPNAPVLEVALSVGFGSGEAFARAFKEHFGMTPSQWRASSSERLEQYRRTFHDSNPGQADRNTGQAGQPMFADDSASFMEIIMNVTLTELPACKVAYMRSIGPYGPAIGRFWEQFNQTREAHGLQGVRYGIGHDDPSVTPPDKCRYDACIEVADSAAVKPPFSTAQLPGGRYALMEFEGSSATIGNAWLQFFKEWLPGSGMQMDARPMFEMYRDSDHYDLATRQFSCALCIPVAPLR
jgi:AraC family transcriptional regulator